jgi:molybdopterin converting factor small subunit
MQIKVRLIGVFQEAKGKKQVIIDVPEESTVGSAIQALIVDDEEFKAVIWDMEVDHPSPNALILLDGIEINNLAGTETTLKPNQELVLLSVVHGG